MSAPLWCEDGGLLATIYRTSFGHRSVVNGIQVISTGSAGNDLVDAP